MYGKGQGDVSLIEFLDGCRDSVLLAPGTINHKWQFWQVERQTKPLLFTLLEQLHISDWSLKIKLYIIEV